MSIDQRSSDFESKRDIPSFIEPRPPLILNPFMRPRPQTGINLMEYFEEEYSDSDEPEWVQVYLRLKPCDIRNRLYQIKSDRHLITSVDTVTAGHGRRTQHNVSKMYTFSRIFGSESNQRDIFETVVKDNLKKLPDGQNFTLLTYGASGSGKTYTLMGTVSSPGLVPRSLEYVFRIVDAAQMPLYKPGDGAADKLSNIDQGYELQTVRKLRQLSGSHREKYRRTSIQLRNDLTASTLNLANRTRYYVWVSFVEIYNEAIYDLLTNCDRSKSTSKLRIREDSNGNTYVKGATQAFVRSGEEAYDVMMAGKHNLQVAETGVHAHSSRSHCIFTITMLTEREGGVATSHVRLCDLAGCERARQTRNTGARMLESRAINASLHVLERCLRMLKRKQRHADSTLVPYRESKLTRLLGAGLSGARLEAVSMVVTLNPASEYAHETRHVLQLAAVARDIQVNSTIAESLESSSQDTIVDSSEEVMRLRAENERLHYELIQAQSCIREQSAAVDEGQREMARTMSAMVEEAKDMTKELYEFQMNLLRNEMEEMREEYETRIREMEDADGGRVRKSAVGTPSKAFQQKISQLMAETAFLQEKLSAEQLARSRLEDQVQHLLACIEERDEKAGSPVNDEENTSIVNDSESEDEGDLDNESLEPTFSKKELNQTRLMLQNAFEDENVTITDSDDEDLNVTTKESNRDNEDIEIVEKFVESRDNRSDSGFKSEHNVKDSVSVRETYFVKDIEKDTSDRNTDLVKSVESNVSELEKLHEKTKNLSRETYCVKDLQSSDYKENTVNKSPKEHSEYSSKNNADTKILDVSNDSLIQFKSNNSDTKSLKSEFSDKNKADTKKKIMDVKNENKVYEIDRKSLMLTHANDTSLAQFEHIEMATKHDPKSDTTDVFTNMKMLKEKRIFFDDKPKDKTDIELKKNCKEKKTYSDNIDVNIITIKTTETNPLNALGDDRSPSIVKDDVSKDFEPNQIKKLLGESFTRPETITSIFKTTDVIKIKKNASVDIFEGFESPHVDHTQHKTIETGLAITSTTEETHTTVSKQKVDLMEPILNTNISAETNNIAGSYKTCKLKDIFDCKSLIIPPFRSGQSQPVVSMKQELKAKLLDLVTLESNSKINDKVNIDATRKPIKTVMPHQEVDIEKDSIEKDRRKDNLRQHSKKIGEPLTKIASNEEPDDNIIEATRKSIEKLVFNQKQDENFPIVDKNPDTKQHTRNEKDYQQLKVVLEPLKDISLMTKNCENQLDKTSKQDNTVEEFENIYQDITAPRITEFELLVSQSKTHNSISDVEPINNTSKYNLRHKMDKEKTHEVLLESQWACKMKPPKWNLSLKKRKNQLNDIDQDKEMAKLKDLVNLQKEFCDVTLDKPATKKEVQDMPSPEKVGDDENVPPPLGIQSCPSKSVTRSRRKLYTPRAEPLEESPEAGASAGDDPHLRAPRPSYHRTRRARRKL